MPERVQRLLTSDADLPAVSLMPLTYRVSNCLPPARLLGDWKQERLLTVRLLDLFNIGQKASLYEMG
jgi:hypothetical protein